MNVITLNHVTKSFGKGESKFNALDDITLDVAEGEFVAIMGPSGSGKSTLMNIVGLLDVPTIGEYLLDSERVGERKDSQLAKLRRQKIGFIFQSFNLLPRLNVRANVELPMIYLGKKNKDRRVRAEQLLRMVGLEDKFKARPNQLSGGQIQRVAIARSLANNPSLILADEPTGNLDSKSSAQVMGILQKLHKGGSTIVMVTHNPDLALYADRTVILRDGQVVSEVQNKKRAVAKPAGPTPAQPRRRMV